MSPRFPLVFLHGFGAFADPLSGGVFGPFAEALRDRGIDAHAPVAPPYAPIAERARVWRERCAGVLRRTGAGRLNLIGFSMGGLDARYLISHLGGHRYTASLTTLSAPHRGTSLASWMLDQPPLVQRVMLGGMRRMGAWRFPEWEHDVEGGLRDVAPANVRNRFNPGVPDHPDVRYFSYGARAGLRTDRRINPMLWWNNRLLYREEGINDGFVSIESARWGTYLGTVNGDHAQLIGIPSPVSRFDATALYLRIAEGLARAGL